MNGSEETKRTAIRLLLVGAGHAHLHLLDRADRLRAAGYRVELLAPARFSYSGVASASVAGSLPADAGRIDVRALARATGVDLHVGRLAALDLERGRARAEDGAELGFDVISVNIGSVVDPRGLQVDEAVWRVKPLEGLAGLRAELSGRATPATISVVGGGSTGIELAAQLIGRPDVARVRLLEAERQIGSDLPRGAQLRARRLLIGRGVEIRTDFALDRLTATQAWADDVGVAHDQAVLATGLAAPPLVAATGLGDRRGVPVRPTLQHVDHDHVFAVGDCPRFVPQPLARVGVHGVRQAPVLLDNLVARATSRPLRDYEPPRRWLSILDLGGGVGLAVRGRFWWCGTAALRLKRRIDRRWLARYRTPAG